MIQIVNKNVGGTLPTELGLLSDLEDILLGANQIGGALPSELGNLSKLSSLSMGKWLKEVSGLLCSWNRKNRKKTHVLSLVVVVVLTFILCSYAAVWCCCALPVRYDTIQYDTIRYHIIRYHTKRNDTADNNLTGSIPSELASLANLQRLDLRVNNVTSGLEENFCATAANRASPLPDIFTADCAAGAAGQDPEIPCSCCTLCE
jgi:Leucine-rich repeat (LRR) protein